MTFETHVHVTSSNIESVAFDAETETMEVRFKNGGLYHYSQVTPKMYHLLFVAESKGRYLNEFIKPHCPVTKIEDARAKESDEVTADEQSPPDPD
jgi:hypothetical protein